MRACGYNNVRLKPARRRATAGAMGHNAEMTRRAWFAMVAVGCAAALALAVSWLADSLHVQQSAAARNYARALAAQARPAAPQSPNWSSPVPSQEYCVRGVNTPASTLVKRRPVLGRGRQLNVHGLAALSRSAVQAERYLEQAGRGTALPQRLGRRSQLDNSGDTQWLPLALDQSECAGKPAIALFRVQEPSAAPAKP